MQQDLLEEELPPRASAGRRNRKVPIGAASFPVKQLIILACCRLSEPISMTSSFPYLFFMIRDFQLSSDERQIGRYAGILASSFTFAQFLSGYTLLCFPFNSRPSMGYVIGSIRA